MDRAVEHHARNPEGDHQPVHLAHLPPDIFRGIDLQPLAPGNTSYILWTFMGFLLVTAVLRVSPGRVGDRYGVVTYFMAATMARRTSRATSM
jgi:hypothetical protein